MINVWMPVFNEQEYLQEAIDSVLKQTFSDFKLLISNNFSTDHSEKIINKAALADSRVKVFSPPKHLTALEHTDFISREILRSESSGQYSIFIGGHDVWDKNLLQILIDRAESELDCAIVYSDSWRIDRNGNILSQYQGIFQTKEVARPLVPNQVLLALTHNMVWGGLWRESKRRQVKLRYSCVGADHLMIAEIALHGSILYQPGSAVMLRDAKNAGDWSTYVNKHIPANIRQYPILDFLNQLEWCNHLIELAVVGSDYSSEPLKSMLKSSLFSGYILRYLPHLIGFNGGMEAFFADPSIQKYLQCSETSTSIMTDLIHSRLTDYPLL